MDAIIISNIVLNSLKDVFKIYVSYLKRIQDVSHRMYEITTTYVNKHALRTNASAIGEQMLLLRHDRYF